MRFARFTVFTFIVTGILTAASPLWAQIVPIEARADLGQPSEQTLSIRLQTGKNISALKAGEGLRFHSLSHNLGHISALALDDDGTLYVADRKAGRVWRLRDRNQDGRFESKQALPQRFDEPSGLAVSGETVFVADRSAVWVMTGIGPPQKLAGLLKAHSKGRHHPLSVSDDGQTLYLGLSTKKGEAELLSLNVSSGEASLLQKKATDQDIMGLAAFGNGSPWLVLEHSLGASLDSLTNFSSSHFLSALALPTGSLSSDENNWPDSLANHVLVSRRSPEGYDVVALPAGFGNVDSQGEIIFSGFLSYSGRSAWGAPGALYLDGKGLIVADAKNGDIYRLTAVPHPPEKEKPEEPALTASTETPSKTPDNLEGPSKMQVSTIRQGSQIGSVSSLKNGSDLEVGSTIIRDYEPLSVDEKDGEKQKTNNSQKRKKKRN